MWILIRKGDKPGHAFHGNQWTNRSAWAEALNAGKALPSVRKKDDLNAWMEQRNLSDGLAMLIGGGIQWKNGYDIERRRTGLEKSLTDFMSGKPINEYSTGGAEAKAILSTLTAAPFNSPPLFRGLDAGRGWGSSTSFDDPRIQQLLTPGSTIDAPISSWSSSREIADAFSGASFDGHPLINPSERPEYHAITLELEPSAQALNVQKFSGDYKGQKEWLTGGRLQVISVDEPSPNVHVVRVRQLTS